MNLHNRLEHINRLVSDYQQQLPLDKEVQKKVDQKIRLEFQYNTNHIEGNTLTYAETELFLIFDETRGGHKGREYHEMKASDLAYNLIVNLAVQKSQPLTEAFIRNINERLLVEPFWKENFKKDGTKSRFWVKPGTYKSQANYVILENNNILEFASPSEIPMLMEEFVNWINTELDSNSIHPVQLAANAHHRFTKIHPFDDGNGRIARLIMNYILLFKNMTPVIIKSEDKKNYLSSLRDADTGNIESFENYIAIQEIASLELFLKASRGEDISEQTDWQKQLSVFKRNVSIKEEIKLTKSLEGVSSIFKEHLCPIIFEIITDIYNNFGDLFLNYVAGASVNNASNNPFSTLDQLHNIINSYRNTQINTTSITISFLEFKKNGVNTFNIDDTVTIAFERYTYLMYHQKKEIISPKYYHERLDKTDKQVILQAIATNILSQLQERVKT